MECHSRTIAVRYNRNNELAQINVVPRWLRLDADEKARVLRDLKELPGAIRRAKQEGIASRVIVVVDGANILSYFDEAKVVLDALMDRQADEALVDKVIVTNASAETKLQFKLFAAATPSLREACAKIAFVS
jgi:hypothetical protein